MMSLRRPISRLVLLSLLCLALGRAGHGQPKPPSLISFNPTQAAAGSTVTITFSGMNFVPRAMNLVFSPSQGITVSKLQVLSPMQISAQVQIDASAQPGSRQIILIDADRSLRAPIPFTITTAQNCPPGMAATACGSPQPALREFSPLQGTQGTSVAITFTGINFSAPASVQFTPANGLTVLSTTVTNANQIQAQVSIAPNASLGARGVVLVTGGKTRLPASNTFTVVSGISRGLPMQILRVIPNQIAAGSENVDLTLQGTNFVPGTQVTFTVGAGVPAAVFANGPARYVNSTEMHVMVNALPSALPGGRDLNLQTPNQQGAVGRGMLNVFAPKPSGPPTVLKIPPITLQNFPLGVIHLDAPLGAVTQSDQYVSYGVPWMDDTAVFKWHEQNPGLADYYELRIYAKDGKTLLATQKISGTRVIAVGGWLNVVPTYYRPDDAFLKEVLDPVRRLMPQLSPGSFLAQSLSGQSSGSHTPIVSIANTTSHALLYAPPASGSNPNSTFPPDQLNGQLSQGDLQWEVAGFHTYSKSGVAPQQNPQTSSTKGGQGGAPVSNPAQNSPSSQSSSQTVDVEVEISDRWPLRAPQGPTGLACNGTGVGTGLQVTNVADKNVYDTNGKPTGVDPNDYIGDPFVLSGSFNLSMSPFATNPTLHQVPHPGQLFGAVDQVQFDSLFVDWGDGSVQPLSAQPGNSGMTNWDRSQSLTLPTNATSPYALQHIYQSPGSYTVRVFQLSEADLQHVSVASVSASVDGPTTPFMQVGLLSKMATQGLIKNGLTLAGVQSNFQQILQQGSSSPAAQVASDAYMIYCHTVNITVPEDLAANGPLHLMAIADPDFGGYDIKPVMPGLTRISLNEAAKSAGTVISVRTTPQSTVKKTEEPAKLTLVPLLPAAPAPVAICSTCDDGMDSSTYLKYYGRGQVRVTWVVDGTQSQQTMAIGPSQPRKNLTRQGFTTIQIAGIVIPIPIPEPPIIISNSDPIYSPALQVQPVGNHNVMVEADVMPQPTMPNLSIAVGKALGSLMPIGLSPAAGVSGSSSKQVSTGPNVAEAQSLLNTLAAPAGSNLPPLKIGILSPSNQSSSGLGAVQYVNGPLQQVVSQLANQVPDQHVASNTKVYEVVASDPKKPCKFLFPVKSGGAFEISGLQNHVTQQGTSYNGTGNLIIHLANASSGGYDEYPPIPVKISNWSVPDGLHVQIGSIDVSPNLTLAASVPALQGTIATLSGQAGGELDATLNVTLSDDTLRLPGEKPVSWSGVKAELHPSGDWMKDGLSLPSTLIGWSAFTMQSSAVRLDLSHHDGDAAAWPCDSLKTTDWVGVRFPSLAITPYTMDLVSGSALQPVVTGWGVLGSGLCGTLSTGPFTASLGAGSISFASINATAFNGTFNAQYKGMDVYVPWLDTHLKGDATLQSGGGKQASISFPFSSPPVTRTYGNFGFTASNLQFTQQKNVGWAVQANTHFVFSAENKQFAAFDQVFYFGMDGRGYFAQGNQSKDVSLGGSSTLGQTPVDLVSVHLTAPPSGNEVLAALFNTNVHLSEVMAAAAAQVNYGTNKSGTNYSTTGPSSAPFTIDVPYPSGQPSSEAKIHPVYSGGPNTEYSGSVDLSELGGPAITGEFRLGYQGGHDYWLTRVGVSLPSGVPVAPGLSLFKVQGGLGHNFPIGAFENVGTLSGESPTIDGSFLFMAGARIGTSDEFTCTVDGDLVIKSSGPDAGARMDFHSWILKPPDNGNGDFKGYFQYAGGNFDGRIWGRLSFMNDAAYADLGSSKNDAAIDLHFGPSGPWHVDFGKQQGPRVRGHLLIADADMYMMLSPNGLSLGGGESIDLEAGAGGISGYIKGGVDMGLTVTPQPHIAGDFSAYVEAGACVSVSIPLDGSISGCVHVGVSAQVHAEFAPLDVHASATVGTPVGDVTVSVHL